VSEWSYEVREGEKIVGEHEVVGREEHDKLRALQLETERRIGGERAPCFFASLERPLGGRFRRRFHDRESRALKDAQDS
jgi:hypothetical protein